MRMGNQGIRSSSLGEHSEGEDLEEGIKGL